MTPATAPKMEKSERQPPIPGAFPFADDKWLCPKCSTEDRVCCDLDFERCDQCEDGFTFLGDLYDQDPLWYDPDDQEPCANCDGKGGWWFCGGGCKDGQHE